MNQMSGYQSARVKVRDGEREIEVEGSEEFVRQNIHTILREMGVKKQLEDASALQLSLPIEVEVLDGNYEEMLSEPSEIVEEKELEHSLIDFFESKAPKNQRDQVLVITYYYLKLLKRVDLSLEDYTEAFRQLRRLGIDTPSNMKSSVRNVVDRTNYLFNSERGRFALTIPGEKLVESMPLDE